jgi:hypothetical protein
MDGRRELTAFEDRFAVGNEADMWRWIGRRIDGERTLICLGYYMLEAL